VSELVGKIMEDFVTLIKGFVLKFKTTKGNSSEFILWQTKSFFKGPAFDL